MTSDLWLYFLAVLAVILLPGMDMAYVLANSLSTGRRGAVSAVAGIATGGVIHVVAGATGIAALITVFPQLFHLLLLLGTLYLLWIGWKIFHSADGPVMETASPVADSGAIYRRAVTTCLLNPKAYAFTFALFPGLIRSDSRSLATQTLALCLITASTQIAVYGVVAALALRSREFMKARQKTLARTMGVMLMAAALATASQAWPQPPKAQSERETIVTKTDTKAKKEQAVMKSTAAQLNQSQSDGWVATKQRLERGLGPSLPKLNFNKSGELIIAPSPTSSKHDFDYLVGKWTLHNHKLKKRLAKSTEWIQFDATIENQTLLNGFGNLDIYRAEFDGKPYEGIAVRLFNPATKLWSIYWTDSNIVALDSPMVGSFDGDIGTFFNKDTFNGILIIVVFHWDKTDPERPIWSQAFSTDKGMTWEWNFANVSVRKK